MSAKFVGYCYLKRRHPIWVFHDDRGYWYEIADNFGSGGFYDSFDEAKKEGLSAAEDLENLRKKLLAEEESQ